MMKKNGFVIPLVLMLISVAMILVTNIYQRGSTFVPFMSTIMRKEQAKQLAISGVHLAMSQLAHAADPEEGKAPKKAPPAKEGEKKEEQQQLSPEEQARNILSHILPTINEWQKFPLKKDIDGIDGTIKIAISCEEGKINLNSLYDFAQGKFKGEGQKEADWKKMLELIAKKMQQKVKSTGNLFESFEKFFKQRHYKVNDASELLTQDGFRAYARLLFYEPPEKEKEERPIYLFDLFTVYGSGKFQPWLLSDSVRGLLDMKRVAPNNEKKKKEMVQELLKKFKPTINVAQDWGTLFQPLYGIEFTRLPKGIEAFFGSSFDPKIFSVVSYGKVGEITQRIYAILERIRRIDKKKTWYDVNIIKFYWI